MAKCSVARFRVSSTLTVALWLCLGTGVAAGQICAYTYTNDKVVRTSGNTIQAHVESWVTGSCGYAWEPGVYGEFYKDNGYITDDGSIHWASFNEVASDDFGSITLSQSQYGPRLYFVWGQHWSYCPSYYCGTERTLPPYDDNWDGWDYGELQITRPTISGLCCFSPPGGGPGGAFWNLGPNTSDPQPTIGGGNYRQSAALTVNSNCVPTSACTATPVWQTPTHNNNQAVLVGATGSPPTITASTATISKGTGPGSQGNCASDTTLTVSISGFPSETYAILVNSPKTLLHTGYSQPGGANVPAEFTEPWDTGYNTLWGFGVIDACGTNALSRLPMNEGFPYGTSDQNGGSNYAPPPGASDPFWTNAAWSNDYIFVDNIGQSGSDVPAPSPTVTYTSSAPAYTYSTVYLSGVHNINAGSTTAGDGWNVYDMLIRYYRDHGDNQQ